jgi:hypothetical protein
VVRAAPPELDEFLAAFPDDVAEIVHRLRGRILAVVPNANEFVWDATNAVSLVYTPTARWQDGICHIATYSKHANLGFNDGASVPDPQGVLQGTGARIRHATFAAVDDVDAPWLEAYLRAAVTQAGLTTAMGDRATTIRISAGPKRRPGAVERSA